MAGEMLEAGIPTPFHRAFPRYFQLTFGVHVYIVAAGAFALSSERHRPATRLGDVAVRTCVSALTSRVHLYCPRATEQFQFRVWRRFPRKNMRVRVSSEQFACAHEFRAVELSSTVPRSSTTDFER